MLTVALETSAPGALGILHGYAHDAGPTADDVADDLVKRLFRRIGYAPFRQGPLTALHQGGRDSGSA
jgi:hypothetical protein